MHNTIRSFVAQSTLDPQQVDAFKIAFQKKIALIQGPPGTGKTFIGAQIIKFMLENLRVDSLSQERRGKIVTTKKIKTLRTGPIMLTCYTNHALDQFLEHISKYTQEIVRLGGRPKEEMKQFSIMEVSKRKGFNLGR